jgi:hypothetical protein
MEISRFFFNFMSSLHATNGTATVPIGGDTVVAEK